MPSVTFSALTRVGCIGISLLLFCLPNVYSQTPAQRATVAPTTPEQRAARAFEAARANPLDLRAFLVRMPKGADLHNHLAGAIYAESWIRAAAEDGLCVDLASLSFASAQAAPPQPACADGKVPATTAFTDQHLYD